MTTRRRFLSNCFLSAALLGASGLVSSLSFAQGAEVVIPVLLYHRIGNTEGNLTITPDKFAEDLSRLKNMGFETISLEKFRQYRLDPETPLPDDPIMISFDDGYLDNYLNAYFLLRQYGMTAAFYIITSLVGAEDRLAVGHIREMAANGMSIGSHTVSHRQLGDMGIEECTKEMILSRLYLEGVLQKSVNFIAYPKGSYNAFTARVANESGYTGGFSILPGTCSRGTNPYVLRRIPVFRYDGDIGRTMTKRWRG